MADSTITVTDTTAPAPFASDEARRAFPNLLSEFVYTRTYSRWMDEEGRRETWEETVDRYVTFLAEERPEVPRHVLASAKEAILGMRVLPSMRALWAAGDAARRDNTTLYNCSSLPIDNLRAFSEALYILMCGTGVGFSVERRFTSNLPPVGVPTGTTHVHVIEDSTEGWADALYFGMVSWFKGDAVAFDYGKVRPRGAPLKTKGGRASGPEPLQRLLDFARETVTAAAGRKLTSLECHDIMCLVGEIVMVGGFRRAALISFSDPDDEEMRHAKDWSRGQFPIRRYMANNSAYYDKKPDEESFWKEWRALVTSRSGERGFYHVGEDRKGFRAGAVLRSNPCVTASTWIHTGDGPRQVHELVGRAFDAVVDGSLHASTEAGFWNTGRKPVFRLETDQGYTLELTGDHRVCRVNQTARVQRFEWVPAQDLAPGDLVRLNNHRPIEQVASPDRDRGWLLGSLLGDGTFERATIETKSDLGQVRFWGDSAEEMVQAAWRRFQASGFQARSDCGPTFNKKAKTWQIGCVALGDFAKAYDVIPASKTITPLMERETDSFVAGLLSGFFDADGSVQGDQAKGVSVRLTQSNLSTLEAAQRMLLRLGIASTIYRERLAAGYRNLPDGHGGLAPYWCETSHELAVSCDNLFRFQEVVGFTEPAKKSLLDDLLGRYRRTPNRERFTARVSGLVSIGDADVFDCSIPGLNAFDGNGLYVHNCGEILLKYSISEEPVGGHGGGGQFCVAGDTPLITKEGLLPIRDAVGRPVHVWNGVRWSEVRPFQTGIGQRLYRVKFSDGSFLDCTDYHRFSVSNKNTRDSKRPWREMTVAELRATRGPAWATEPFKIEQPEGLDVGGEWAYTLGAIVGDGCVHTKTRASGKQWKGSYAYLFGEKDAVMPVMGVRGTPHVANQGNLALKVTTSYCADHDPELVSELKEDPQALDQVFRWSRSSILDFLAGWLDADGTQCGPGRVRLYLSQEARARKVQLLLTRCGLRSSVGILAEKGAATNLGLRKEALWYVDVTDCASLPCHRLDTSLGHTPRFKSKFQTIRSIEELPGLHATFCFEESERHMGVFGNTLTYQCNLSAAVMRSSDTRETMAEKVRIATWLGAIQASFTHFPYLRPAWTKACEDDRLLGVDITGHCDNPRLSNDPEVMRHLNKVARETAAEASAHLGINMPVAITCGKPSGNSSQFVDCASGFHPRYAKYYFRHVRTDAKDPLTSLIRDAGVPLFKENGMEHLPDDEVSVWVARFPVKAPEGAMVRDSETAVQMCERYLHVMRTWCGERGHNQSATIYVRDHEWDEVGRWLYEHFDEVTGLSFLPSDGGKYKLAPYEEITAEQYAAAMAEMPEVDFGLLTAYEREDRGRGATELACVSGTCET